MAWTIDQALEDVSIKVIRRRPLNEYQFTVGELKTVITIRTYEQTVGGGYIFEQSHFIKTPLQPDYYCTSRPWGDYEAYAVHQAISTITEWYRDAVNAGHTPSESWLISNKQFVKIP
jgi:hypothetical protein